MISKTFYETVICCRKKTKTIKVNHIESISEKGQLEITSEKEL